MLYNMKNTYIDGPMGQVHVRELGEGRPLVLLHQTAWSSLQFKRAMPILARNGFRCIAIDTPGFGLSDGPEAPPSIEDYANSVAATLKQLGVEQAAVLGHHTGASIGAALANDHPEIVSQLLLHGVPIYSPEKRAERLAKPHFDQTPKPDGSHFIERWALANSVSGGTASPEAIHWSLVQFFWAGPKEWFGHHAAFKFDMDTAFRNLTVPTVVISNTGDVLHERMSYLRDARPDFTYAELDGGTFHIIFDEPERWATFVAGYVLDEAL